ncbi:hypothetical protein JCM15519_05650 [Fundidesulfovibrio butyratiphilus]
MNLADAYRILGVAPSATLEDVKKGYRQQAFRHHPDLNAGDHLAKRRFQKLNEAYLLLRQVLAEERAKPPPKDKAKPPPEPEKTPGEGDWKKAKAAYKKASRQDSAKTSYYFRREDVLQDILKDPFARQVFDDIYNELRKGKAAGQVKTERNLGVSVGDSKWSLNLSGGFLGSVASALKRQLDDEQTVQVPPTSLLPGSKLRVGIAMGLSSEQRTVEFTLPKDYTLGQPIRLKGLGRRIGPWKGDLYLRLVLG